MVPSQKVPHNITPHITCSRCNQPVHYALACLFLLTGTPQLFQCSPTNGFQLTAITEPNVFDPGCIIVDSGSSFNSFRDSFLLSSIVPCTPFDSITNGGGIQYTLRGTMTLFLALNAYYDPNCLANILSLDLLQSRYHVAFNSSASNTFVVHLDNNSTIVFHGCGNGLYMHKLDPVNAYSFLNTVSKNKSFYSRQEVKLAEDAREQQGCIVWPSNQEYWEII